MKGLANVFLGCLFDNIGTGYTRILITFTQTLGLLLMFFVDPSRPWLLYPGTILISVSGLMILGTSLTIIYMYIITIFTTGIFGLIKTTPILNV